jgi:gamma-glutamyltranspeptidase / glutathione hydrolase
VLGGGTWALYYNSETGKVTILEGVVPVGSKADLEDYSGDDMEEKVQANLIPYL